MSLADTLPLASFFDLLRVSPDGYAFDLDFMQQRSLSGGGERLVSDRAPPMLSVTLTSVPMPIAEAEGLEALIKSRAGGLKSFLLCNNRMLYPSSDPDGTIFGAATPTVGTITDRLHVAFTGFPNNYVIPLGTWFGIVFDTSRYYLGQFVEARTANGSGAVASVEVFPPLPASISTGAAVTVKKPPAKFRPVAGTVHISSLDKINARVSVSAEQTYSAG